MVYPIEQVSEFVYKIPQSARSDMLVPGFIYADEHLAKKAQTEGVLEQVVNVATLPGIIKGSLAMPDIHLGYGFAVGGVAAFSKEDGVISPGGVGFDINCGVRLLKTELVAEEVKAKIGDLMHELSRNIPKGVGSRGKYFLNKNELTEVLVDGIKWAVKKGLGWPEDIEFCEQTGRLEGANPEKVSQRAFERGARQLGTIGAGNHFLEVQELTEIIDEEVARGFGLFKGQLLVMIHSGSRGFGHQVCTDYLKSMGQAAAKYGIRLPDRQLASAPATSVESQDYYGAMACAMNYAWTNRHIMAHLTRESFEFIFRNSAQALGMHLLYDVAHNSAKFEKHIIDGKKTEIVVHRKGATRAFGPGLYDLPEKYKKTGQPVLIPGDMGRASYILSGTQKAMEQTFGSTCHGAGRLMSRSRAKKMIRGDELKRNLEEKGIVIEAGHIPSLSEEAPEAYKDVNEVVEICHGAGISNKVAKVRPLGVLKG